MVHAIDRCRWVALTDEGAEFPVTTLFDAWGNETDDWDDAVSAVAGPDPVGRWHSLTLDDFTPATVH